MQFTEYYDNQEYPRTKWTTKFFINEEAINGFRIINAKHHCITIEINNDTERFKDILVKIDRLCSIDDELFVTMSNLIKEAKSIGTNSR